jgi:protein SCO1
VTPLTPALSRKGRGGLVFAIVLAALALPCGTFANNPGKDARLPKIGPAPDFTLTNQDGKRVSLNELRGQVTVVTFIFTSCSDTCPLLTAKLVGIQRRLGMDEPKVAFAAITVDPLNDTPPVLKKYAVAHSANLATFSFLTGSFKEIENVTRGYAVYWKKQPGGNVDHTFLTSIVDRNGTLRVQYLGVRFDPKEFQADLKSVLAEGNSK